MGVERTVNKVEYFDSMLMGFATNLIKQGIEPDWYNVYIWEPTAKVPYYDIVVHTSVDNKIHLNYSTSINDRKRFVRNFAKEFEFADLGYKVNFIWVKD